MTDVDCVCHVVLPYFTSANDPLEELIEPAVNGTKNVVSSALKATKLKRPTIMSLFASVLDLDKNPNAGYTYTDKDWYPVTVEKGEEDGFLGYHASKTFAERAAWNMWKEAKPLGNVVTFRFPMIYGPPVHEVDREKGINGLSTRIKRLATSVMGTDPAFAPKVATLGLPARVNVRNVAEAHAHALKLPKGTSERFLLFGGIDYFEDGLQCRRARGEKGLSEVGARCDRNKYFAINRSKAEKMLELSFIPFEKTVEDIWETLKSLGFVG